MYSWIVCIFMILCILKPCTQMESDTYQFGRTSNDGIEIELSETRSHFLQKRMAGCCPHIFHRHLKSHPFAKMSDFAQRPIQMASEGLFKNGMEPEDMDDLVKEYRDRPAMKECRKLKKSSVCDPYQAYRTLDGSCNNLDQPNWGAAFNCLQRLMPANYIGEGGFRKSICGSELPTPRRVSLNVHYQINRTARDFNTMYVNFGQFLAHDMSHSPMTLQPNNSFLDCCNTQKTDPQCSPILMEPDDPFYSQFNVTCMADDRSALCSTCKLGHREQFNQLTSFIDGSQVYGSTEEEANNLRNLSSKGMLKYQSSPHGDLLPRSEAPEYDECSKPKENKFCFKCGDDRCNQNPALTSMQTLFLRHHNSLAEKLSDMCPDWSGDKIYLESRKILGAELQVIVYKEYLPITLGQKQMDEWGLTVKEVEPTSYDPKSNPMIMTEFSAAAFRFGHSLVDTAVAKNWPSEENEFKLRDHYFQPFFLYDGLLDSFFEKVVQTPSQESDRFIQHDMSHYLVRLGDEEYGYDSAAVDVMRGRDHGLPSYTQTVEYCTGGKTKIRSWRGLYCWRKIEPNTIDILRKTYRDPRDIDLWTGLMCEEPMEGAVVGPTAACIISRQFHNLKYGDRFFFEHDGEAGSFTEEQRQALKQVTLSSIICSHTAANRTTENAMIFSSDKNPEKNCEEIRGIDLSAWMDCD